MTPETRQKALVGVLALLLLVAGWRFVGPALNRLASSGGAGALGGTQVEDRLASLQQDMVDLDLAALAVPARDYTPGRNIFRIYRPPLPPPAPPPPYVPPPVVPVAPPPPVDRTPQPPAVDVSLVGIFGPESRRIAVLTDGEEIINALERDEVNDKFIVNRIGFESIDLGFVGFPDAPSETLEIGS